MVLDEMPVRKTMASVLLRCSKPTLDYRPRALPSDFSARRNLHLPTLAADPGKFLGGLNNTYLRLLLDLKSQPHLHYRTLPKNPWGF